MKNISRQSGFTPHHFWKNIFHLRSLSFAKHYNVFNNGEGKSEEGFTLMEIVVATTLFATVLTLMLSLFTYTLKINRRTEALRQVSQSMRNFTEFVAKEVRNGKIDYSGNVSPCLSSYSTASGYTDFLGLINANGEQICLKWTDAVDGRMYLYKNGLDVQTLNPANIDITVAKFHVRPVCDPTTLCYPGNKYPGIQPFVTIVMQFQVTLPTGETRTVPYQTTISTDQYDVPHKN